MIVSMQTFYIYPDSGIKNFNKYGKFHQKLIMSIVGGQVGIPASSLTNACLVIFMVTVDSYAQLARRAIMNCVIHLIHGKGNPKTGEKTAERHNQANRAEPLILTNSSLWISDNFLQAVRTSPCNRFSRWNSRHRHLIPILRHILLRKSLNLFRFSRWKFDLKND